jgi:hypothetical protein
MSQKFDKDEMRKWDAPSAEAPKPPGSLAPGGHGHRRARHNSSNQ